MQMTWNGTFCDFSEKCNRERLKLSTDDLATVNIIKELLCLREEGKKPYTVTEINEISFFSFFFHHWE